MLLTMYTAVLIAKKGGLTHLDEQQQQQQQQQYCREQLGKGPSLTDVALSSADA